MSNFYNLPRPWNPGYVIPEYVMAEPPERGTFTTQWLPRGTISQIVPDFVAKPGKRLLGRNDAGLGSLGGDSLGADEAAAAAATATSPAPTVVDESAGRRRLFIAVGAGALAYYLLRKKRR